MTTSHFTLPTWATNLVAHNRRPDAATASAIAVTGTVALLLAVPATRNRIAYYWSFVRMALGLRTMHKKGNFGDGREEAVLAFVKSKAPRGDADAVLAAIDDFASRTAFLINVGDAKGLILEESIKRARPKRALELGAYVGYSAIRQARLLRPGGHLYTVEFSDENASVTQRMIEHAGLADRVTVVLGSIGDGGKTIRRLNEEFHFNDGKGVDHVFVDHAKEYYLSDLKLIMDAGWLHKGTIVTADNILVPGVPDYRQFMKESTRFKSVEHKSSMEYTSVPDIVLVSEFLG